jgi:hypothetical protein
VRARHASCVQVIAQSSANAVHFVGSQLLALATSAKNNSKVCLAIAHMSPHGCTNWWVVAALCGVRTQVVNIVSLVGEHFNEMLLQGVPGVIGANCNA